LLEESEIKPSYIGIDIIEIERIRRSILRYGDRFLKRIYTDAEINLYRKKLYSLAVRFAGKEAAFKALGGSGFGFSWREIEILSETAGKPEVHLSGIAAERASQLGLAGLEISLSHCKEHGIALVIGIREE
jgi:holo-[acyl-carrier protein] synthase